MEKNYLRDNSLFHARAAIQKDIIFRRWISLRKGVYAKISDITQPNKYLDVPHRDVTTRGGIKLTLINPSIMIRQVHQLQNKVSNIFSHISSLNPIRPGNRADEWETSALKIFEKDKTKKEISKISIINKDEYLRLIIPLKTEKSCLHCHSKQGYKEGDIRGGISTSIPLKSLKVLSRRYSKTILLGHLVLWILILSALAYITIKIKKKKKNRLQIQNSLELKETVIDSSANAIIITELNGTITYANNSFLRMWHIEDETELFDRTIQSLIKIDSSDRAEIISIIKDIGSWIGELIAIRAGNSEFNVLISASLIKNKNRGIDEIAFSFSDITMRKHSEFILKDNEEKLRKRNDTIERDLKIAQIAQKELITGEVPKSRFLHIHCRYLPMEEVGGDYFSFSSRDNNNYCIFIGDISGHGVASALYLSLVKSVIERLKNRYLEKPSELLTKMGRDLYGNMSSYFITGIYGFFEQAEDKKSVTFTYANGGHINPLVIRANKKAEFLTDKGTIIGISDDITYSQYSINLFKGDRIFLYTDGIPETENSNKEMIGFDDELIELFSNATSPMIKDTLDKIIDKITLFRGNIPISDDIILIGIEIK